MSGNANDWPDVAKKTILIFKDLVIYIFKVEGLTPVGRMNFVVAIGFLLIFMILAIRGAIQNDSTLGILFAFCILVIMSVSLSSQSYEHSRQKILKKL